MTQPEGAGLIRLVRPGRPFVHLVDAAESALASALLHVAAAHPQAAIRRIRGAKSRGTQGFFDEIAAAMQFPYYFGENWHALEDCLLDLTWLPAEAYLLVIEDADEWLVDEPAETHRAAFEILSGAAGAWQGPADGDDQQPGLPFHLLVQAPPSGRTARLLREAAIEADSIDLEP